MAENNQRAFYSLKIIREVTGQADVKGSGGGEGLLVKYIISTSSLWSTTSVNKGKCLIL